MNLEFSITKTIGESEGRRRIYFLAFLSTIAIFLSIIEHIIPKPLPWMRFGLANAITLYAFTFMKPREVFLIVLTRVLATSFLLGSFLSITFILSLTGALTSFVVMYFFYSIIPRVFSIVGISILGALTSSVSQLIVVNYLFVNNRLSYYILPFILLFALIGGLISGLFGRFLIDNI